MLKAAVEHGLGSMIDRRVVTELIGWLVRHPQAWNEDGSMFSVNLTKTALHDEHFMKFLSMCLDKAALPAATIAFEVDVPTAIKFGSHITEVAVGLNRLGCPLVLDDRQGLPGGDHGARANVARAGAAHGRETHRNRRGAGVADRARRRFHPVECAVPARGDRIAHGACHPPPSALTR
jgi:hypothetical protein